jgi:hypothetical protein
MVCGSCILIFQYRAYRKNPKSGNSCLGRNLTKKESNINTENSLRKRLSCSTYNCNGVTGRWRSTHCLITRRVCLHVATPDKYFFSFKRFTLTARPILSTIHSWLHNFPKQFVKFRQNGPINANTCSRTVKPAGSNPARDTDVCISLWCRVKVEASGHVDLLHKDVCR